MERGGMALVVARYIPGGRTAVTLTTGAIRFPFRTFVLYDALAAVSWAVYCALVGYIGGAAFEENPLYGVVLGVVLALVLATLVEVVRSRTLSMKEKRLSRIRSTWSTSDSSSLSRPPGGGVLSPRTYSEQARLEQM